MYRSRSWMLMSGALTTFLTTFAVVITPPQNGWWWRVIVIALAGASIAALWRGIMLQPIPRPHPLRLRVEEFICELSKAKSFGNLGNRAAVLNRDFVLLGMIHSRFPKMETSPNRDDLDRAAICFREMLSNLPY